ncbi:cell cycle regulator of non-homologous end joining-like [Cyprinodon tularosa]|uniref:cell cycle regulator of non-homologous end joining-like n=1 Tax=Cyprinodon tularosa TaxID=77115 RepID=UPI0018E2417D|nr:cell cycle regulator of non-homologous end joining-like [Cyprinodon tularosa]
MAEKQRELPSWMTKKEAKKVKENAPMKSQRTRKAARAVFYCMNEAELVEAAVSFLTEGSSEDATTPLHQQAGRKAKSPSAKEGHSGTAGMTSELVMLPLGEESSDCCEDLETTYVSETDLDITEVETVPYTRNSQHPEPGEERSGSTQGGCEPMKDSVPAENESEQQKPAEEEDDAFRLVREIFFT